MKHTQEKAELLNAGQILAIGKHRFEFYREGVAYSVDRPDNLETRRADAERMEALWNAVDGIPTSAAVNALKYAGDLLAMLDRIDVALYLGNIEDDPRYGIELRNEIKKLTDRIKQV